MTRSILLTFTAAAAFTMATWSANAADEPKKTAVFDVEVWDTSGVPDTPEQDARVTMLSEVLRQRLAADPGYALVDLAPEQATIDAQRPLYRCGGCQLDIARRLGARYAIDVIVRKMSLLIQEMTLLQADLETDQLIQHTVQIRNNSDEAWRRGLLYILDNRLLAKDPAG